MPIANPATTLSRQERLRLQLTNQISNQLGAMPKISIPGSRIKERKVQRSSEAIVTKIFSIKRERADKRLNFSIIPPLTAGVAGERTPIRDCPRWR